MTSTEGRDAMNCAHCGRSYSIRATTPEVDQKRFYCSPRCWRAAWRRAQEVMEQMQANICAWCRQGGAAPIYSGQPPAAGADEAVWKYMHISCLLEWKQLHAVRKN